MSVLDIVELGEATNTCRERLRQLLSHIDDAGEIPSGDLVRLVEQTSCSQGHNLRIRELTDGMLCATGTGHLRLGLKGDNWLIEHGRPPAEWGAGGPASAPPLRAWQREALDAWSAHGRFGVVEAVTGTGKSRVGVEAIREALDDDYNVVVVVPTVDLVEQWERTLRHAGILGVAARGPSIRPSWTRHQVIVSTVQSLYSGPPQRADHKVLIVADECHRYGAPEWSKALSRNYRRRLGLTATFERNDEGLTSLMDYFGGGPVYRIGFPEAIRTDVVARYDVKLMGVDLSPRERREYDDADDRAKEARTQLLAADFPAEPFGAFMTAVQQAAAGDEDPTVEDVARRYLKAFSERVDVMAGAGEKSEAMTALAPAIGASRGALVFTRRKQAAEELALVLKDEGLRAEPLHSDHTRTQRRERLADLKTGRTQALVAPTVLDEGVDVPDVDLGVVMSGSKSRRQMIQRMGRVLRRKADGRKATFIVVYAKDTAEDLSTDNGQEGSLDLIVESADSVVELRRVGDRLVGEIVRATGTTTHSNGDGMVTNPQAGQTNVIKPSDIARPRQSEHHIPEALREVDPDKLQMTRSARDAYARFHEVSDGEAEDALRVLLRELLGTSRAYPRATPYGSYALRGDAVELVITPDRFAGYRWYGPSSNAGGLRASVPVPAVEPVDDLTEDEVDVLDALVPATIQIGGEALERVCDVFELGDLSMSDALREARALFEQDLGYGAKVAEEDGGYGVRGLLATWHIDDEISQVVGVSANYTDDGSQSSGDGEDRSMTHDAARPASDGQTASAADVLVTDLERLGSMWEKGWLTDEEFTAAKAKLIF